MGMFEPLFEIWLWMKSLIPSSLKPGRPHFNYITVHYVYMISLSIVGSILLYPAGALKYIDALFFAAGAATQSGLNTVNVNDLHTYQQIILMLMACVANPVFINTVVVFVRLYWFEKRFQGIVSEAARFRRTRSRSRTFTEGKTDQLPDPDRVEYGVNGRQITVLHHTTKPNGMNKTNAANHVVPNGHHMDEKEAIKELERSTGDVKEPEEAVEGQAESGESSNSGENAETPNDHWMGQNPALKRDIMFADEVDNVPSSRPRDVSEDGREPERRGTEHHIAFLEKQRKKDQTTLRIPGPRDFDKGDVPRELDSDEEGEELDTAISRDPLSEGTPPGLRQDSSATDVEEHMNEDDHPVKRGIAFDEPARPKREARQAREAPPPPPKPSTRLNPLRPLEGLRKRKHSAPLRTALSSMRDRTRTFSFTRSQEKDMPDPMPYLSWQPTIGRNSAFVDLSEEQREELGGIEYRSLKTLAWILVCYFFGFHLLGVVVLLPWIINSETYGPIIDADGQTRGWWGVFTPLSMFNDLGFTLTPDSMISFQTAVLPLLFGSFLIIIGNTGFPCMLRFVIWSVSKMVPKGSGIWEELRFLLDHPRRCFTLLFPSQATWWLFWILLLLNVVDLIFFIILDLHDSTVTSLTPGFRVLNGWFQAASTRTAGFSCVNLAELHPAIQVSYMVMMYISVFPIAISVRRTNVYEEKSLGIYAGDDEEDEEGRSYVGQHLRRQLSFDLWYIFLGLFIIAIVEGGRLQSSTDDSFTLFTVLFEIVSAYGTVGLSLGYPNIDASFSAEFAVLSKLIIVAMMIRGRHRGLPYALDRAILLPSENQYRKEAEDASRRARRNSLSVTQATTMSRDGDAFELRGRSTDIERPPLNRPQSDDFAVGSPVSPVGMRRVQSRRGSDLSTQSRGGPLRQLRERRLSTLIAGAMSAGPSSPGAFKHD